MMLTDMQQEALEIACEAIGAWESGGPMALGALCVIQDMLAIPQMTEQTGQEPVAYEFQHDETGRITYVDPWQVEQGFATNNPRWRLIGPVYRHAARE